MRFTRYFETVRQRPDRAAIRLEWIEHTVKHPTREQFQQDGRIRRWAAIPEWSRWEPSDIDEARRVSEWGERIKAEN